VVSKSALTCMFRVEAKGLEPSNLLTASPIFGVDWRSNSLFTWGFFREPSAEVRLCRVPWLPLWLPLGAMTRTEGCADSFHQVELNEAVIGTPLQVVHLQVNGLEGDQGFQAAPESSGS
jgi:hypothetical protein